MLYSRVLRQRSGDNGGIRKEKVRGRWQQEKVTEREGAGGGTHIPTDDENNMAAA